MSFLWSFGSSKKEPAGSPAAPDQPQQHNPQQHTFKTMSTAFRRGVQYNMKIVVRGDVMTGKSTLFNRLQGAEFDAAYKSTPEIQVANIPWQYKDSNDVIKIEVWDVVDKAHNKTSSKADTGIKLEHNAPAATPKSQQEQEQQSSSSTDLGLDASTVNVYRNSHAALFVFDITKPWTFDYVNNELTDVPQSVSVLVLGNFSDKSAERVVSLEEIHATLYQHNQERIEKGAIKPNLIRYAETSMKTGLGLQYIYDYLGVPFLQLQMETFKKQLELKATEIVDTLETLDTNDKVPDVMQRRRGQDNFDQPSEPHLARQREDMKKVWDQELEDIATDNSPALEVPSSPSFIRKETPPPPTAPVRGRRREGSLVSDSDRMPAAVDQFDAGELEDDWFGEDTTDNNNNNNSAPSFTALKKQDSDNEDYSGNPMVAGDEDVESVEYYNAGKSSMDGGSNVRHIATAKDHDDDDIDEEKGEEDDDDKEDRHSPAVFHSELSSVWGSTSHDHRQRSHSLLMRQARIESDSEDEDNAFSTAPISNDHFQQPDIPVAGTASPSSPPAAASPFMAGGGFGGYEEIGGDSENPWSWDDRQQQKTQEDDDFWADTKENEPQATTITSSGIQHGTLDEPVENPEAAASPSSEKSKGKKKASSSSSGTKKKKSKDGKKKKKKTTTSP